MALPTKNDLFDAHQRRRSMDANKAPAVAAPSQSVQATTPAKVAQVRVQDDVDAPLPSETRAMIKAQAAEARARMEVKRREREAQEAKDAAASAAKADAPAPSKKPSKKRRNQVEHTVTLRDLHILKGLEKPGIVSRGQIQMIVEDYHRWQGGSAPTEGRIDVLMRKLVRMALVKRSAIVVQHSEAMKGQDQQAVVWSLTKEGHKLLGGSATGPVVDIGISKWAHELAASWIIITHWIDGWSILSAAEIDAASKRSYSETDSYVQDKNFKADPFYGDPETCLNDVGFMTIHTGTRGGHRPDAVLFKDAEDGQRHIIAVEVERSKKRSEDLDAIFYGYHSALDEGRFTAVRYYYAPEIKNHLENYLRGKSILIDRRFEFIPFDAEEAHAVVPTVRS